MGDVKGEARRGYHAPARQARAAEARRLMLARARELFAANGYAATSVEDIAQAAGVGRRTVYDAFGNKRGLLLGLLGELAPGEQTRFQAGLASAAGAPAEQLRLAVSFVTTLYERAADVLELVHAAGGADPDLAALDAEGERRRLAGQRPMIEDWHRRHVLRPQLTVDKAADILWSLTSPRLFRLFVTERGWDIDSYRGWLHDQLVHALLRPTDGIS